MSLIDRSSFAVDLITHRQMQLLKCHTQFFFFFFLFLAWKIRAVVCTVFGIILYIQYVHERSVYDEHRRQKDSFAL